MAVESQQKLFPGDEKFPYIIVNNYCIEVLTEIVKPKCLTVTSGKMFSIIWEQLLHEV